MSKPYCMAFYIFQYFTWKEATCSLSMVSSEWNRMIKETFIINLLLPNGVISLNHFTQQQSLNDWKSIFEILNSLQRVSRCIQTLFNFSGTESSQFLYMRLKRESLEKHLKRRIKALALDNNINGFVRKLDCDIIELVMAGDTSKIISLLENLSKFNLQPLEISNKIGLIALKDYFFIRSFNIDSDIEPETICEIDSSDDGDTVVLSESSIIFTDSVASSFLDRNLNSFYEIRNRLLHDTTHFQSIVERYSKEANISNVSMYFGVFKYSKDLIGQYNYLTPLVTKICLNLGRYGLREESDLLFIRMCVIYGETKLPSNENFKPMFVARVSELTRNWLEEHANIREAISNIEIIRNLPLDSVGNDFVLNKTLK